MSEWAKFGQGARPSASTFDTPVGNGKFFDVGIHKNVKITEIEGKKSSSGNPYVSITLENDEGATIKRSIMLSTYEKDGIADFHWTYKNLAVALCKSDAETRNKFFIDYLPDNPEKFKGLIGLKCSIKVERGKKGYIIKDTPSEGKILVDITTDEQYPDTIVYNDYTEAKAAAKELGLYPCYNEVTRIFDASSESVDVNIETIKGLMNIKPKKKIASIDDIEL